MPEQATSVEIDAQYRLLREGSGLVERDRGQITVRGPDAAEYLQGQLTNEIEALAVGEGRYAALLDRKGHLQADLRLLRVGDDELWLDTEPEATAGLLKHLTTYKIGRQVEVTDLSAERSLLSVIGPSAAEVSGTAGLRPENANRELQVGGSSCRAIATDLGIDLICTAGELESVRAALLEAGAEQAGEEAAEILRVEAGRPRLGREMSEATMPAEAGIVERAVDFSKGCYIGQEPVARLHYRGKPNRTLRGLKLSSMAEAGEKLRFGEREVGELATSCLSPSLGPIALAVVRREAETGDTVEVGTDGITAELVGLPFDGGPIS
ncbi:MAG: folate-binding protein [Solirubrobacterales bacterium]|nr:folate-binding protein [Solirubrobacterales bacterium]